VEEREVGVVIRDFRHIAEAVRVLLTDGRLERFRANARRLNNRAVYEIPAMLEKILAEAV
jgi:1,2-diacylglycerol 3-beta-galactosyltransferase